MVNITKQSSIKKLQQNNVNWALFIPNVSVSADVLEWVWNLWITLTRKWHEYLEYSGFSKT